VLEGVEDAAVHDLPERAGPRGRGRGGESWGEALAGEVERRGVDAAGGERGEDAAEGQGPRGEAREDEDAVRGGGAGGGGAGGDGEEAGGGIELEDAACGEVFAEERRKRGGGGWRQEVGEEEREEGDGGSEVEPEGERGREGEGPGCRRRRRRRRRWSSGRRAHVGRRVGDGDGGICRRHCWARFARRRCVRMGEWSGHWELGSVESCSVLCL